MNLPREFFIEDRLEAYRFDSVANLGESGLKNFSLGEILLKLKITSHELEEISLADSPNSGSLELREEIAKLFPDLSPDQVLVTTGTTEALFLLFSILVKSNTTISYFSPAFQALYEIPKSFGGILETVNVEDKMEIKKLFQNSPDLVIINNPHNPTGLSISTEGWKELELALESFSGFTIFDEHYRFFLEDSRTGVRNHPRIFGTGSITKCFGVTGLRAGWLVGNKEVLSIARSFKDYITHTVNPISEFLMIRMLKQKEVLIQEIRERVQSNIDYFKNNWKYISSIKNFFPDPKGLVSFPELEKGISSEDYSDKLYKETGVFVLPGKSFESEGHIRIGFGETKERFEKGIDIWKKWKYR
ncbi:MAG: pyridoxal phosphate-dependent aminotransferase [Leptospiraceae bacterium]|nr:pyridoxal phosphate-dependent aminotransferase [Leptospiraceae bacterium]